MLHFNKKTIALCLLIGASIFASEQEVSNVQESDKALKALESLMATQPASIGNVGQSISVGSMSDFYNTNDLDVTGSAARTFNPEIPGPNVAREIARARLQATLRTREEFMKRYFANNTK